MDANNIRPRFEFGFGLSYTTFAYSGFSLSQSGTSYTVTFTVANTGAFAGAEKPQLYLSYPASAGEPPKVLRGFEEVILNAGASSRVSMTLSQRDMRSVVAFLTYVFILYLTLCVYSIWDVPSQQYVRPQGTFGIMVGASSLDVKWTTSVTV
jgi:beta-glucosidase